jgi:HEAT repeat protein
LDRFLGSAEGTESIEAQAVRELKEDSPALVMRRLGEYGDLALPLLLEALSDGDPDVRASALTTLGELGIDSSSVRCGIARLITDAEFRVRFQAALSLVDINRLVPPTPPLVEGLYRRSAEERILALEAIGKTASAAGAFVGHVAFRLDDEDWLVRDTAVRTLGSIGTSAASTIPVLLAMIDQGETEPIRSVGLIGAGAPLVIPKLEQLAMSEDSRVPQRMFALEALGNMGHQAARSVPVLLYWARRASAARREAIISLGQVGVGSDEVIATLRVLLVEEDAGVRLAAIAAVVNLGLDDPVVWMEMERLLSDDNKEVRAASREALSKCAHHLRRSRSQ